MPHACSLAPMPTLLLLALLAACSPGGDGVGDESPADPGPRDGTSRGGTAAGPPTPAQATPSGADPAGVPADAPLVVFLGDSLSAGLHLPRGEAFPAVVQDRLLGEGLPFRLVNAGVSGDTTAGGRARLDWLLGQDPAVVVVELGGNDGLRGVALDAIEDNLRAILRGIEEAGAVPLLLGMRLPSNYGGAYGEGFAELYDRLAEETGVAYVPFFMAGVFGDQDLFLGDALHPSAEGHRVLADAVAPRLAGILAGLEG